LPLNWIEQQLAALGTSSNDLVLQENQRQAIDQVSVRNSIGTLRFIGATDGGNLLKHSAVLSKSYDRTKPEHTH
jgi:hypothetical protein